jgi:hypothetical protein
VGGVSVTVLNVKPLSTATELQVVAGERDWTFGGC